MNAFLRKLSIGILAALCLAGCSQTGSAKSASAGAASAASDAFEIRIGEMRASLEIAARPLERARGLMFRERLGENAGMIFVFEEPARRVFWMKNTGIPLDLGFFTRDGVLREVRPLYPFVLDSVESSRDDIALCVEMPQGWFAKNKIGIGARLDIGAVRAALAARGLKPATYGL